ncbi:ACP phosphodiesterase [Maricurvus nonylphenolicus]|uniref:acyl carrier protein phosphodiesterase n=1 Tax=Maricurvus nonylphenolicus TaxID=1008307 RepID=UPI0036F20155
MNYLAHLLLSGDDPEWQLGGFLGDFVKGPLTPVPTDQLGGPWSPGIVAGMTLHRAIDAYVDQHPLYLQALSRLGPEFRRIGGIALDIAFDHLLAIHWQRFSDRGLDDYCQGIYRVFSQHEQRFPPSAALFSERMREFALLQSYRETETLEQVLIRVGKRLRFENRLAETYALVEANRSLLTGDFLQLMPELVVFAGERRTQLLDSVSQL